MALEKEQQFCASEGLQRRDALSYLHHWKTNKVSKLIYPHSII